MKANAQFHVLKSTPDYLLIEDLGPWDQFPTITNDAEYLVHQLLRTGVLSSNQKLLYSQRSVARSSSL